VVVADLSLKDGSGIELIKMLRSQACEIPILVLTMHEEPYYAERALRAGARGFLTKREASEKILSAIRQVAKGELYVSERLSSGLINRLISGVAEDDDQSLTSRLSDRELEVFLLIGEGQGTQDIADRLHLSVKTIETYRAHLKEKLNLRDARELVQYAIRWLVSHDPK
jgi:DNA-binding NarL/FixJ family response regulator